MPSDLSGFKGVPLEKGKLALKKGKYFLTVKNETKEIPLLSVDEKELDPLIGEVNVVIKNGIIALIMPKKPPYRCFICYYPSPELFKKIKENVRDMISKELISKNIITEDFYNQFK